MKTQSLKKFIVGLAFASAMAIPAIVHAQQPSSPSTKSEVTASETSVSGKITEKTSRAITVSGQSIAVTSATSITKGGERVKLEDLKVGDRVSVSTIKTEDGRILAVTVEASSAG